MSSFKSFDYFSRLPKSMTEGSTSGMMISIVCTLLIFAVLYTEVTEFFSNRIHTVLKVEQLDPWEKKMHINIDIHFPNAPCMILSLDQQDLMGTHIVNVNDGLRKVRYDWFGTEIGNWDWVNKPYPEVIMAARDAFDKEEGCAIKGWLLVNWVPGNFHIASHDYN